jgi:Mce-associated membrane protein
MEEDAGPGGLTPADDARASAARPRTRLSRRWWRTIAIAFTVLTAGIGAVGHVAVQTHWSSQSAAGADAAAVAAAKECVAATQPSDVSVLPAVQRLLDDCATGDFKSQITWYSAVLSEAYHAVNLHVCLPEMDAAVESTNTDGSIVALVAFRASISQDGMADRVNSYRMRVTMVPNSGHFKIAKLDQVGK